MSSRGQDPPRGQQVEPRRTEAAFWCNACGGPGPVGSPRAGGVRRAESPGGSLFCEACGRVRPLWLRPLDSVRRLAAFGLISQPAGRGAGATPRSAPLGAPYREEQEP